MLSHPDLSGSDIVRDTVKLKQHGFAIIDRIAGQAIAVSGLACTAGVDDKAILTQCKFGVSQELAKRTIASFIVTEHKRHMRVTHQAKLGVEVGEVIFCVVG